MAADLKEPPMKTAASLVTGILTDLHLLVEQQFQLTRYEIEQELRQRAAATAFCGAGMAGYFLSAFMLSLAAAHLLHWAMLPTATDAAEIPLWACEGGVAVVLSGIGVLLVRWGRRRFREVTLSQNPATEIFQESQQWKTGPR